MEKRFKLGMAVLFIVSFVGTAFVATNPPDQSTEWVAPASAKATKNPLAGDKKSIKRGQAIYKTRCVICHGATGIGDGPGSKALNPKPANHTSEKVQKQTDGEIFWKISEGRGAMIGWGKTKILKEQDMWDLVNYVRTLKK